MTRIIQCRPYSDEFDEAVKGYVMASRINDVVADPGSKRYREYLHRIQSEFMGETVHDPADVYRDRDLVPRAIEAYELRHDVELTTGQIYFADDFPICAAPDAIEGDLIGLTVHIRQTMETYESAAARGVDNDMLRHALAMMAIIGLSYWLHLNYYENAETRVRRLSEHEVWFDLRRAKQLEDSLIQFAAKSRFRVAEAVA